MYSKEKQAIDFNKRIVPVDFTDNEFNLRRLDGTNYQGKRKGFLNSFLDRDNGAKREHRRLVDKYGAMVNDDGKVYVETAGITILKNVNPLNGEAIPNSSIFFNKKNHTTDKNGNIKIINGGFLKDEIKIMNQRNEYLKKVVALVSSSDEMATNVLFNGGKDMAKYILDKRFKEDEKMDEAKYSDFAISFNNLPQEIRSHSGMPSLINILDSDSSAWGYSTSRLKWVCSIVNPIIDDDEEPYNDNRVEDPTIE